MSFGADRFRQLYRSKITCNCGYAYNRSQLQMTTLSLTLLPIVPRAFLRGWLRSLSNGASMSVLH